MFRRCSRFELHVRSNVVVKNLCHNIPEICTFLLSHTRVETAGFGFYYTVVVSVSEAHVSDDIFSIHDYFSRKDLNFDAFQPTSLSALPSSDDGLDSQL
jgi:hypothetical protein